MRQLVGISLLLLSLVIAQPSPAQQGTPGGVAILHITCADTGAPARFARVTLAPILDLDGNAPFTQRRVDDTTDRNGDVVFSNVSSGMYFIDATLAGYIQPLRLISEEALQSKDPQTRKLVLDNVPHLTVESSATTRAAATLERGAVISGRVGYDDGAPVENIPIRVTRVSDIASAQGSGDGKASIYKKESSLQSLTDDRGMYRVAGLSPGTYIASARIMRNHLKPRIFAKDSVTLATTQPGDVNLTFYAPATTQRSKAQQIAVAQGDERQGIDLVADLSHLHSVAGYVNRHGTVLPDANVELDDIDDPENRHGTVADATGYFRFDLLPQATYKLTAYPPRNMMESGERKPSASMPLTVTDIDTLDVNVDLSSNPQ